MLTSALKPQVFPQLLKKEEGGTLRIRVPGCSTGEETDSLAICLLEYLDSQARKVAVKFFGTVAQKSGAVKPRLSRSRNALGSGPDITPKSKEAARLDAKAPGRNPLHHQPMGTGSPAAKPSRLRTLGRVTCPARQ